MRVKNGLTLLFVLGLFFSCSSRKMEIHIHDRNVHSYNVIKNFIGISPPPALVFVGSPETQSNNRLSGLLLKDIVSDLYWISDMEQLEQTDLLQDFIVSIDLSIFVNENRLSSAEFLRRIIKWLDKHKPRLVTVSLSGTYQHKSGDMYSFLTEIVQSLPSGTAIYLESETVKEPENPDELYRWQNWYGPVSPNKTLDPNIRPDPWVWYSLPAECVELLQKKKVIIQGENRDNILAVWNDPAYKKLRESYNREAQKEILQSARESIFRIWNGSRIPDVPPQGTSEGLAIRLMVHGKDRGCLTWYKNSGDIRLFAAYCAAEALRDPRYAAIDPEEAEVTLLELVIFGNWEDISNPQDFIPGYHNLWLINGVDNTILQASLVPQRYYSKEDFLENICRKAGLDKNAWKENKNLIWRRSPGLVYAEPLQP